MALDRTLSIADKRSKEQSESVDRLFNTIKDIKKDRDELEAKRQEILRKDREAALDSVASGNPLTVTSEGIVPLSQIDPSLEEARQDILFGKQQRAAEKRMGTAVAAEAAKLAVQGDTRALDALKAGDLQTAMDTLSPKLQTASLPSPAQLTTQLPLGNRQTQIEQSSTQGPSQTTQNTIENLQLEPERAGDPGAKARNELRKDAAKRELDFAQREREISSKAKEQAAVATEKERQVNLGKVRRLRPIIKNIRTRWLETQPESGGTGRLKGIFKSFTSDFQSTPQDARNNAYKRFRTGLRAQLARAMGDVGNLSVPEQQAAMDLVPSLQDNLETGKEKLKNLEDFIGSLEAGNTTKAQNIVRDHKVKVVNLETGQVGFVLGKNLGDALSSGKFERANE
jgi:hypothetical protein